MNPFSVSDIVRLALEEDLGPGDITSRLTIPYKRRGRASLVARGDLVLSGLTAAVETLHQVDPTAVFTPLAADGDRLRPGAEIARVEGPAQSLLASERVTLNFLMHMSGVATLTAKYVAAANNPRVSVIDTRKTTPGLRLLEKAAVRHGGGRNHRFALYDGILIKDNHIAAAGSIAGAVEQARRQAPHTLKIEVEVETLEQLREALAARPDMIMLDNIGPEILREGVRLTREHPDPTVRGTILEASGGINLQTIGAVAQTGVDMISVGALTHSAPSVDLGLDWDFNAG
ncbi:MAG: carboxylating nicotinate-nucleotide diphosphorylase [Candidatus Adiutrix sp.]|jgi:nicotinate-nucleotide pyrophosphorylase (carboxylating)|nr:carboxylating nicotinate-nucleotide diphosphorylase [Candidatus Adiutrix sp.]